MAASTYLNQVQQLYIAYFGRPADPVGQRTWAQVIDDSGGSIAAVLAGFSASNESQALYGTSSTSQKVAAIYSNVFNRAPEAAGLAYWVNQIDSGKVTQAQAAWSIQQAAGAGDASTVNNKLIGANAFTAQIDTTAELAGYTGATAAASARAYLNKVDASYASIANVAVDSVTAVGTATGTGTPAPPVTPTPPAAAVFSVAVDGSGVLTFTNAGTTISASLTGGTYTFTTNGASAATVTSIATINTFTVPAATSLTTDSVLAVTKIFAGTGTVVLSDTGPVSAANLKTIEAATSGLLEAGSVTSITAASVVDATSLLVTKQGTSGDKIHTAANVTLALTDTSAAAADLNTLDAATTGLISASSLTTVTGNISDITTFSIAEQAGTAIASITNYAVRVDNNESSITAAEVALFDTNNGTGLISTTSGSGWTITALNNATVAATSSKDTFIVLKTNTNINITDFTSGTDFFSMQSFNPGTQSIIPTGVVTAGTDDVYFLGGQAAGAADTTAAAANALNSGGLSWAVQDVNAYIVVVDNNSSALYKYVNTTVSGDGLVAGELNLIAIIATPLARADVIF